jgi:DNA-binding transcriptional regulator YhcF (GntR family)
MTLTINTESTIALHEQLRTQIIDQVRAGQLAAGAKLPTVRGLAESLAVAPNTVAKAYRELEADDIIETRGRAGTFVSAHGDVTQQQAQLAARSFADRVRQLGVPADAALEYVTAALRT